jgi:hypothetical protein
MLAKNPRLGYLACPVLDEGTVAREPLVRRKPLQQFRDFLRWAALAVSTLAFVHCGHQTSSATDNTAQPACTSDSTCVRPAAHCNAARCVECTADADCRSGSCDLTSHSCGDCIWADRNMCVARDMD